MARRWVVKALLGALVPAAVVVSACGEQPGPADAERFSAELRPLNGSGVNGGARLDREGEHLTVTIDARGLQPNRIHQQAVHGFAGDRQAADCPRGEGEERGTSVYGPRLRSLEPYPTVGSSGRLAYRLTFTSAPGELNPLDTRALVLRGRSARRSGGGSRRYRPDLPVACGLIRALEARR